MQCEPQAPLFHGGGAESSYLSTLYKGPQVRRADRQTAIAANNPTRLFLGRACKEMTPSVEGFQSVRGWALVPHLDIISFMLRLGPALPNPVLCSRSVRVVCFI
jgi:hypothetical protein